MDPLSFLSNLLGLNHATLLYNGTIVTMDAESRVYKNGALLVVDDSIKLIGHSDDLLKQCKGHRHVNFIDLKRRIVLPGLINTHVHTSLHFERNLACDVDLGTWLTDRGLPLEANMTEEDSYLSTLACGIELIRSGVTCFAEAGGQHVPGMVRAVEELGLRGCLSQANLDSPEGVPGIDVPPNLVHTTDECIQSQTELHSKYNGCADGRVRIWFGIRQITGVTAELLTRTRDSAKELQTGVAMHLSEIAAENQFVEATYGVPGTVTYLDQIKLLDRNFLGATAVWINEEEIEMLAKANASVSHCPAASMHYFGFAPIKEMLAAGVTVSLGTDGPSNNRLSIIDEMYVAAISNKVKTVFATGVTDPTAVPAEAILKMVTIDGAKAVMWDNEIGSLEVGKKADLVIVSLSRWTPVPVIDKIASLVYSVRNENIESVMCNGKWIMRDHKILTVNEEKALQSAAEAADDVLKRAGIVVPERMNFI